jgi:hypothetical protein
MIVVMIKFSSADVYFSPKTNHEKIYYQDPKTRSEQRASRYFMTNLKYKKNNNSSMDGRSAQKI